jgi:hypothetical protein
MMKINFFLVSILFLKLILSLEKINFYKFHYMEQSDEN